MALGHLWLSYRQGMVVFSLGRWHSPQGAGEQRAGQGPHGQGLS